MKSLSTAPAPAHKFHRAQAICMKDKAKNDNYLGVTFSGEATGPDILLDAVQILPVDLRVPFRAAPVEAERTMS